jgi:hypothetical protein
MIVFIDAYFVQSLLITINYRIDDCLRLVPFLTGLIVFALCPNSWMPSLTDFLVMPQQLDANSNCSSSLNLFCSTFSLCAPTVGCQLYLFLWFGSSLLIARW